MHFKFTERCETCSSLRIFVILSGRVATAVIQLFSRQTFLLLSFDHIRFSAIPLILFNKISSLEKRKQLELCWYPSNRTHRYSWKTAVEIRNVKKHKKKSSSRGTKIPTEQLQLHYSQARNTTSTCPIFCRGEYSISAFKGISQELESPMTDS